MPRALRTRFFVCMDCSGKFSTTEYHPKTKAKYCTFCKSENIQKIVHRTERLPRSTAATAAKK